MEKRKKLILILFLIVFIGGMLVVVKMVKNKPTKEQQVFANNFAQKTQMAKNTVLTGTVESLDGGKMTVHLGQTHATVGISKDTPVTIMDKNGKATRGQVSDVKLGDVIKVEYDKVTMNVSMATLFKL
jgi:preprotein translocase subunit YajC